jgi:hypothetical protein
MRRLSRFFQDPDSGGETHTVACLQPKRVKAQLFELCRVRARRRRGSYAFDDDSIADLRAASDGGAWR